MTVLVLRPSSPTPNEASRMPVTFNVTEANDAPREAALILNETKEITTTTSLRERGESNQPVSLRGVTLVLHVKTGRECQQSTAVIGARE